jgi:hypothetical protein
VARVCRLCGSSASPWLLLCVCTAEDIYLWVGVALAARAGVALHAVRCCGACGCGGCGDLAHAAQHLCSDILREDTCMLPLLMEWSRKYDPIFQVCVGGCSCHGNLWRVDRLSVPHSLLHRSWAPESSS